MPDTLYAKSGDVHIAYQVLGEGPIDIVYVGSFFTHLELLWEHPGYRAFCREMSSYARLILMDKRGMGLSDHVAAGTLGERMDDVRAVLDAAGSERAVIFGASEGGPLAILFAVTYPERTRALVLWGSDVCQVRSDDWPYGDETIEEFEASMAGIADWWGTGKAVAWMAPSLVANPVLVRWAGRLFRHSASPGTAEAYLRMAYAVDIRHLLPAVAVPTLVAHRVGDESTNVGGSRYLAGHIRGANYAELPGSDHWVWLDSADFLAVLRGFLERTGDLPARWPGSVDGPGVGDRAEADEGLAAAARERLARADAAVREGRLGRADADARAALALALQGAAADEADAASALLRRLDLPRTARPVGPVRMLTRREAEILRLVARGLSNDAIARFETISPHTVHRHVANILDKLGVASRAAAVAEGARLGLL
jgi:pimeloyl-ACP methyl ester carboxylesterase/DNA-binding CsgD family transcriptional regulator